MYNEFNTNSMIPDEERTEDFGLGRQPEEEIAEEVIKAENTETENIQAEADNLQAEAVNTENAEPIRFEQMQLSPEAQKAAGEKKRSRKREKKERAHGAAPVWRMAVNGAVFGLCGALVFSGVMVIGNHTFLKKDAVLETSAESETARAEEKGKEAREEKSAPKQKEDEMVRNVSAGQTAGISEIAEESMPSIVSITVKGVEEVRGMFGTQRYEATGAGSGIVVDESNDSYLIATNNHVVESAEEVSVCFNDSEDAVAPAQVVGTDAKNDLAIVSVKKEEIDKDVLSTIKVIDIGSSDDLRVGDQVVAIGNALGYGQSVTTGIVSALDREVKIENLAAKLIQTDAAINPGNSGGALLNMQGQLVGINSAKFASATVEGMGYAIPINTAKPILNKLMSRASKTVVSDEEAGFLGVTIQNVTGETSEQFGIPEGVYIGDLEEDGAAAKAGLKKGDVITQFDGIGVSDVEDLKTQVSYFKKGDTVEVTYMRLVDGEYKEQKAKVTLQASEAGLKQRREEKEAKEEAEEAEQPDPEDESEGFELPDRNKDRAEENGHGDEDEYPEMNGEDLEEFFERFFGQMPQQMPEGYQRGY